MWQLKNCNHYFYIEEAMQVTSEAVSGVARRLTVTVPTSRVNEQFEAR